MNIDWNIVINIGMPILMLCLGVVVNHLIENRPKLISHLGYISSHKVKPKSPEGNTTVVNTHSVIIKNTGRKAAKNVRLGHNFLPDINVYPDVEYIINDLPEGGKELLFPTVVPKKEIVISYLYFPPDTWDKINTHIESDDGAAKIVKVLLQPQPHKLVLTALWALIIIGLISSVYLLIELIKFAI